MFELVMFGLTFDLVFLTRDTCHKRADAYRLRIHPDLRLHDSRRRLVSNAHMAMLSLGDHQRLNEAYSPMLEVSASPVDSRMIEEDVMWDLREYNGYSEIHWFIETHWFTGHLINGGFDAVQWSEILGQK